MSMQCPAGTFSYVIRSGDNFFSLAQRFNTTVNAIIAANPGVNPNALQIGQTVCIPGTQPPPPTTCPTGTTAYIIRSGDTLFELAQRFNTSVNAILTANPGIDPNALRVGQRICIPGVQPPPPTTCPAGTTAYIIRSGDTLFELAQRFNTSVNAILAANPGIDPNALRVGQRICIPGVQPPPPTTCPTGTTAYIIRSGDTLFELARRFNTSVNAILAANPGIDPNALRVGQRICIPGVQPPPPTTCPTGTTPYIIRSGDTLFELARRFNTTINAILAANPGLDPNALRVGQQICIPGTTPPPGCPAGTVSYVVRAGDNLFRIAQRFNVTVNAILAVNPGLDPNRLTVGMVICIPQGQGGVCPGGSIYTIRAGDTFFSIAQMFDVSLNALIAANPGVDPNRLFVGQQICIPEMLECPGNRSYVILPGETLTTIAEKFVVSVSDLLAVNPGLRPSDFIPGRRICIPLEEAPV